MLRTQFQAQLLFGLSSSHGRGPHNSESIRYCVGGAGVGDIILSENHSNPTKPQNIKVQLHSATQQCPGQSWKPGAQKIPGVKRPKTWPDDDSAGNGAHRASLMSGVRDLGAIAEEESLISESCLLTP